MISIRTASRLHFGLLSLARQGSSWPNRSGEPILPARSFGGVGLMVERPGLELTLTPAQSWSAHGPLAERALAVAQRAAALFPGGVPCSIEVRQSAPEHVGLGTGTQLALAIGQGLARLWGLSPGLETLARLTGRGLRSGLGAYGFQRGGFLVEAGKVGVPPLGGFLHPEDRLKAELQPGETLSPLAIRLDFPEAWRVLLLVPHGQQGLHGSQERQVFARLLGGEQEGETSLNTDALCRLVLLGMVPALQALDADAFGEALYDFDQRVGEAFAAVQGGTYSSPWTARWVDWLRREGVRGAGQSSWGPTVFGVTADPERADRLAQRLAEQAGADMDVCSVRACNQSAQVVEESSAR